MSSEPPDPEGRDFGADLRSQLRLLCHTLDAGEASFWRLDDSGTTLRLAVNHGPQAGKLEGLTVPVDDSVVGMVASTLLATAIGPDDAHNTSVDEVSGVPTRAMVAAAVTGPEGLEGVLSVINPNGRDYFSEQDLQALVKASERLGQGRAVASHD